MTKPDIVILGASGHAMVIADILRTCNKFEIVGFLDDIDASRQNSKFCHAYVLGDFRRLASIRSSGVTNAFVAIGDCSARARISTLVRDAGFTLVTVVHPSAIIANDVLLGVGTCVMPGVVINPSCTIGAGVILNTSSSVDHECNIGDNSHLSPGVRVAGAVSIGESTWIGIGTAVSDHIRIGNNVVIGAGSLVLNDIPDGTLAYGVPAKVIRKLI